MPFSTYKCIYQEQHYEGAYGTPLVTLFGCKKVGITSYVVCFKLESNHHVESTCRNDVENIALQCRLSNINVMT